MELLTKLNKNIFSYFLVLLLASFFGNLSAQTGPGGVGNEDGTASQPNNELWFDVSNLGLSNNTAVTTLTDRSGNANDATQATVANKPIYYDATHASYSYPVMYFDGTDDFMPIDGSVLANKDYTVIFVGQRRSSSSTKIIMGGTQTGANNNLHPSFIYFIN